MSVKRTVRALSRYEGRVYVYLKDHRVGEQFLRAAESEGFTFGDGAKPTERHYAQVMAVVMAVRDDGTISFVGAMGMAAFGADAEGIVRVDFAQCLSGSEDFFINKQ